MKNSILKTPPTNPKSHPSHPSRESQFRQTPTTPKSHPSHKSHKSQFRQTPTTPKPTPPPNPKSHPSHKSHKSQFRQIALTAALLLTTILSTQAQTIRRVTPDGAGSRNGTSWENAMTLNAALAARGNAQIWIAAGTYKPHTDNRSTSFSILGDVSVYGGFAGTEDAFDPDTNDTRPRDGDGVLTSVTILSGDLDGDDGDLPAPGADQTVIDAYNATRDDNSYRVVILLTANRTINGLTITAGSAVASGIGAVRNGGGLSSTVAGTTLVECTFTKNRAANDGGAAYFFSERTTLTNCTFSDNTAGNEGGGVYFIRPTNTLTNCVFTNNTARDSGGGVYFTRGGILNGCTFTGNTTAVNGGGAYFEGAFETTLTDCTFTGNTAQTHGGGARFLEPATLIRCTFTGNTATANRGGGASFQKKASLTTCTFTGNMALADVGGGAFFNGDETTLTGCMFDTNTAETFGGGANFFATATLTGCTFTGNTATTEAAGGASFGRITTLTNCTFMDNTSQTHGGGANFSQISTLIGVTFTGNTATTGIGGGALFTGNATLKDGCTFTANTAPTPPVPGEPTTSAGAGGGAFFNAKATLTNTSFTGVVNTDGTSVVDPDGNPVPSAANGGGAYFNGAGTSLTDCAFNTNVVSGNGGGVYFNASATLTNTTFSSNAANENTFGGGGGGGYFDATVTLNRCSFTTNEAAGHNGGGAYFLEPATLISCTFTTNNADYGGATYFTKKATITNCVYDRNAATDRSGASRLRAGGTITNSTFYANTAVNNGGAISVAFTDTDPSPDGESGIQTFPFILRNSILMSNTARDNASGQQAFIDNATSAINSGTQTITLDRNLIAGGATPEDPATSTQGVIYTDHDATITLPAVPAIGTTPAVPAMTVPTITETLTNPESNTGTVFASTTPTDPTYLRLAAASPAINVGDNDYLKNGTEDPDDDLRTDRDGVARKQGGTVDLGAYESNATTTQTIDFADLPDIVVVGAEVPLAATATSGLPVVYTSSVLTVATVERKRDGTFFLRFLTTGTTTITASQPGDTNYEAATPVTQTITVRDLSIFHVTTAGTDANDGGTWATPMDLQTALAAANSPGDQVWIAEGTYTPVAIAADATPSDEQLDISFRIAPGVLVFGGFAGSEPDSFDPAANPRTGAATILSGDLNDNDGTRPAADATQDIKDEYAATRTDNSRTVVTITGSNTSLDGLTITAGEGGTPFDFLFGLRYGGGLSAFGQGIENTTLKACMFTNNNATGNGGGAAFAGMATLTDCTFMGNAAESVAIGGGSGGGAIFGDDPTLTNCTFSGNTAENGGGARFTETATLTNCMFSDNTANNSGGGASFFKTATLNGCTFTDNTTNNRGGGAYFGGAGNTLTDCMFITNNARNRGGGAYFNAGENMLTGCTFTGNEATSGTDSGSGGGAYFNSSATLTSCTFTDNEALFEGGGAYFFINQATLSSCIFMNNKAINRRGGALFASGLTSLSSCSFMQQYR